MGGASLQSCRHDGLKRLICVEDPFQACLRHAHRRAGIPATEVAGYYQ